VRRVMRFASLDPEHTFCALFRWQVKTVRGHL
jgi:hypothetical protein